jgi:hypothetical protein
MSIKKLILKHGIDIIVTLVLLSYIVMDVKVPDMMNNRSKSILGLIVLSALALLSFTYFHPIVGFLAIFVIFKMIVDNRQVGTSNYPQYQNMAPQSDSTETFSSQMPSTELPEDIIRSNDDSLEEEVISNMAPLSSSSNYMNSSESDNISPILAASGGSSLD